MGDASDGRFVYKVTDPSWILNIVFISSLLKKEQKYISYQLFICTVQMRTQKT